MPEIANLLPDTSRELAKRIGVEDPQKHCREGKVEKSE